MNRPNLASIVLGWAVALGATLEGSPFLKLIIYSFVGGVVGALGGWLLNHVRQKIKYLVRRSQVMRRKRRFDNFKKLRQII